MRTLDNNVNSRLAVRQRTRGIGRPHPVALEPSTISLSNSYTTDSDLRALGFGAHAHALSTALMSRLCTTQRGCFDCFSRVVTDKEAVPYTDQMTSGILLYSRSTSSASYRVRIALNLKKQHYDLKVINTEQQHHKSGEYLSLNPQGLVPLLVHQSSDQEVKLNQSVAIMEYLEETFPQQGAALLPKDHVGRARVRSLALHIACEMQPLNNSGVVNFIRSDMKRDTSTVKGWQLHWAEKGFTGLENQLKSDSTGRFCHGDSPTLADCCLVPQVSRELA